MTHEALQDKSLLNELAYSVTSSRKIFTSFHDDVIGRENIIAKFCRREGFSYMALDARACTERNAGFIDAIMSSSLKTIVAVTGFEMSRGAQLDLFQSIIEASYGDLSKVVFIFLFGKNSCRFKEMETLDSLMLGLILVFIFVVKHLNSKGILGKRFI